MSKAKAERDAFITELQAAIHFDEDEATATLDPDFLLSCFTTKMSTPFRVKTGSPQAHTTNGLAYEEVGWNGETTTCGPFGHRLIGDRMEAAVSGFAAFISAIQGRRFILGHDTIEWRIPPEIGFRSYGRSAMLYARLVTYNHAEVKQREPA